MHTLSACWGRPSLTALEILWRWVFGIPALLLIVREVTQVLRAQPLDTATLDRLTWFDPMGAAAALSNMMAALLPPVLKIAQWVVPVLGVAWVVISAFGRSTVLRRAEQGMHRRVGTLMLLQTIRLTVLGGTFVLWFVCLRAAASFAIDGPIAAGAEPNLVLYFAIAIVCTLGLFTAWAVTSWAVSVAPLLAMQRNLGAAASLRAAFCIGPLRSKLVEINLVMGIVKIALIVLGLVLSACPLPFQSVATTGFMMWWYVGVTVLYLIASDFFHVVHLVAYLDLGRATGMNTMSSPALRSE